MVLVQPTGRDLDAMGINLMDGSNRNEVIELARETVAEQLAADPGAELLRDLPPGDPDAVRMPDRPVAEWPDLEQLGARIGEVVEADPI